GRRGGTTGISSWRAGVGCDRDAGIVASSRSRCRPPAGRYIAEIEPAFPIRAGAARGTDHRAGRHGPGRLLRRSVFVGERVPASVAAPVAASWHTASYGDLPPHGLGNPA